MYFNSFTLHGHRGCRGLLPENTIPAFHKAIDLGCHYLEMDVVITKDNQVLVSHEPWLNHQICLSPDGKKLTAENERQYNLYKMTYEQIRQIDCGSIGHPRFPQQQAMRTYKPLLSDMIDSMEAYTKAKGLLPVGYNIEVKRVVEDDHVFHPDGELFSKLIIDILKNKNVLDRAIFQTFDLECMEIAHRIAPDLTLSFLVDNEETAEQNINKLSFVPPIYGPWFKQIDTEMMLYCNKNNIKVIPWTVNELQDIRKMLDIGVSGLISDYPDRVQQVLKSN
jgi:glycerophosphoryl diester phosphodiesterase